MNRLELSARCKIREGQLDGFKDLAAEFIRQTRERDSRTLRFDWFLSRDQAECEIREEYLDAQGFMEHKANTAEVTRELFSRFADDHRVSVFGDPPPMLVERVERSPMGPTVKWFRFLRGLDVEPTSYRGRTPSSGAMPGLELGAHMTVRPNQTGGFGRQAAELVRLTRLTDTRTLRYDWFVSRDGTECEVREAYVDGLGLIEHNTNVSSARDVLFDRFADNHFMTAYGDATQQLLGLVDATHMEQHFKWFSILGGLDTPIAAGPRPPAPADGAPARSAGGWDRATAARRA